MSDNQISQTHFAEDAESSVVGKKLPYGTKVHLYARNSPLSEKIGRIIGYVGMQTALKRRYIVEFPNVIPGYGYTAFTIDEDDFGVFRPRSYFTEEYIKWFKDIRRLRPYLIGKKAFITHVDEKNPRKVDDVPLDFDDGVHLTKFAWAMLDSAVVSTARRELPVFCALVAAGCDERLPFDSRTVMHDEYPLPIFDSDFIIPVKQLEFADGNKRPVDTTDASKAAFIVANKVERLLMGVDPMQKFYDMPLYGLCNHPNRLMMAFAHDNSSISEMLAVVRDALLERGCDDNFLVILSSNWSISTDDVKTSSFVEAVVSKHLPDYTFVIVELSPKTITAFVDLDMSLVQWGCDGFDIEMKLACRMLPFIRSRCGIAVVSVL